MASTALLMPRWSEVGLAPAVTLLEAFFVDGFGENGRRGGAVARDVAGLAGDFAHELGAHVFVGILKLDLLGDRDTVLGDGRGAEFLVEDDVAAGWPEGCLDGASEFLDAAQERVPGCLVELELFSGHVFLISVI